MAKIKPKISRKIKDAKKYTSGQDVQIRLPDGSIQSINTASPLYAQMYDANQIQNAPGTEDQPINLQEVTVRPPKGFWDQSYDKFQEDNKNSEFIGAMLSPFTYALSLPQQAMMYGTTGKVQDPSEALGIENPYLAFAANAVLDPANIVGAGLASKGRVLPFLNNLVNPLAGMNFRKGAAKQLPGSGNVDDVGNIFKGSLTDKEKEMYQWFEKQQKLNALPTTKNKKTLGVLEDFKTRIQTSEGKKRMKELGIDSDEMLQKIQIVEDPNTFGYFSGDRNRAVLNPLDPLPTQTARHEIEHGVQNAFQKQAIKTEGNIIPTLKRLFTDPLLKKPLPKSITDANTKIDDLLSGLELRKQGTPNKQWRGHVDNDSPVDISEYKSLISNKQNATDYFLTGSEGREKSAFLAEVQQYMMDNNIIPKTSYTEVTPEMVKNTFVDAMFDEEGGGKYLRLFNIIKPTEANYKLISEGLNKMLGVIPPAAIIGAGALQEKKNGGSVWEIVDDIKQEGGNIPIDPMGYWNPNNYDEPAVTIPSNEITMQGIDYPIYGEDNTGYGQMMYPGEDYAYPGDYVTEYPLPEAGGGYRVIRSNERKGKTHKVIGPGGKVKFFGDSKLGQHPKDPARKKAFYARHKKNLANNPYFRAFARKTWEEGGLLDFAENGLLAKLKENLGNLNTREGYNTPIKEILKTGTNKSTYNRDFSNKPMSKIAREQDAFRIYLDTPTKTGAFEKTGENKYRIRDYQNLFPDTMPSDADIKKYGAPEYSRTWKEGNPLKPYNDFVMGRHTVTKGKDDKGEYLQYRDVWNLDPSKHANNWIDQNVNPTIGNYLKKVTPVLDKFENIIFNPFELTDKIYYDPVTKLRADKNHKYQQKAPLPGQSVPGMDFAQGGMLPDLAAMAFGGLHKAQDGNLLDLYYSKENEKEKIFPQKQWLENWINHPEFQKRLANNLREINQKKFFLHQDIPYSFPFTYGSDYWKQKANEEKEKGLKNLKSVKEFYAEGYEPNINLAVKYAKGMYPKNKEQAKNQALELLYVSKGQFSPSDKSLFINSEYADKSTPVHEYTHSTYLDHLLKPLIPQAEKVTEEYKRLEKLNPGFKITYDIYGNPILSNHDSKGFFDKTKYINDESLKKQMTIPIEDIKYLNKSQEIYPRIMELRYENYIKPGQIIDKKSFQKIKKTSGSNSIFDLYNDEEIIDLMNKLAKNKETENINRAAFGGNLILEKYQGGGSKRKKKKQNIAETPTVDMYGRPIESRFMVNPNVERSYYDPRRDAIFMQKDYNQLDPYDKEKMLAHENYHAYQFKNDRSTYLPVRDIPYQRPPMVATDEYYYGYHNRKPIESQIDIDRFKEKNPSFRFVSDDAVYNFIVDPEQYLNPETFEGEAKFYEDLGVEVDNPAFAKKLGGSIWEIVDDFEPYQYQKGGKVVSEIWKDVTGTSWSEAKKLGLTKGGYEENLKLRSELLKNPEKFAAAVNAKTRIPIPVSKPAPAPIPVDTPAMVPGYSWSGEPVRMVTQPKVIKMSPVSTPAPKLKVYGPSKPKESTTTLPKVNYEWSKEDSMPEFELATGTPNISRSNFQNKSSIRPPKKEPGIIDTFLNSEFVKDVKDVVSSVRDVEDIKDAFFRGLGKTGLYATDTEEVEPMAAPMPKVQKPIAKPNMNTTVAQDTTPTTYYQGKGVIDQKTGTEMGRYVNTFSNWKGQEYIPTKNVGEWKKDKSTVYPSSQMAHYLLDVDLTTGFQHPAAKKQIEAQKKGRSLTKGSTLKEQWLPVYEKLDNGNVRIKYKTNKELTKDDKVAAPFRQYKFGDLDWGSNIKSNWNKSSSAIKTKTGEETRMIKSGKDMSGYGQFGGGSFVLISKRPSNGEVVVSELSGSLQDVKNQAKQLAKLTGQDLNEIVIAFNDVGSWSAKPASRNKKLTYQNIPKKNKKEFQSYQKDYTGAGLAFPF